MTIVFDANPNPSTKAMQGQEEGRGKHKFVANPILSERASNRSTTSNSSVKILCLNSSKGSSSINRLNSSPKMHVKSSAMMD